MIKRVALGLLLSLGLYNSSSAKSERYAISSKVKRMMEDLHHKSADAQLGKSGELRLLNRPSVLGIIALGAMASVCGVAAISAHPLDRKMSGFFSCIVLGGVCAFLTYKYLNPDIALKLTKEGFFAPGYGDSLWADVKDVTVGRKRLVKTSGNREYITSHEEERISINIALKDGDLLSITDNQLPVNYRPVFKLIVALLEESKAAEAA